MAVRYRRVADDRVLQVLHGETRTRHRCGGCGGGGAVHLFRVGVAGNGVLGLVHRLAVGLGLLGGDLAQRARVVWVELQVVLRRQDVAVNDRQDARAHVMVMLLARYALHLLLRHHWPHRRVHYCCAGVSRRQSRRDGRGSPTRRDRRSDVRFRYRWAAGVSRYCASVSISPHGACMGRSLRGAPEPSRVVPVPLRWWESDIASHTAGGTGDAEREFVVAAEARSTGKYPTDLQAQREVDTVLVVIATRGGGGGECTRRPHEALPIDAEQRWWLQQNFMRVIATVDGDRKAVVRRHGGRRRRLQQGPRRARGVRGEDIRAGRANGTSGRRPCSRR